MIRTIVPLACLLIVAAVSAQSADRPAATSPIPIIFDTDMGPDCDDVGAHFILHGAMRRGQITLLATMGCVSTTTIAPALDAINTWFGHPEIPVGTLKDPGFLDGQHYTALLARQYPHALPSGVDYPDAVALYRQILAKQPDASVVIVAVGPLRNLGNLLASSADATSPLAGPELVKKKVKKLFVMGGTYPPKENKSGEWNFLQDPKSAVVVCSTWPTPVVFDGDGGDVNSGRRVTAVMPEHNPLTLAYTNYPGSGYGGDRLSWDPITCLVAVSGAAPWYQEISGGTNVVDAKGVNTWTPGADRGHSYLKPVVRKAEIEDALEDLMTAGKARPTNLTWNTASYALDGACHITSSLEVSNSDPNQAAIKAFDGNDKSAWRSKGPSPWIQCQYADGRKYLVTSYALVSADPGRQPRSLRLSGSNDDGRTWTDLDVQQNPGFSAQDKRREFTLAKPQKWNCYRVTVTAANADEGCEIATLDLNEAIHCQPKVAVASLTVDRTTLTLPVFGRATLNASLAPARTFEREVLWVSSDPAVAEVRRVGEQIAMVMGRKAGTCVVTASIDGVMQTCAVTITPSTLADGWAFDELAKPAIPGAVTVNAGVMSLTGCGHAMTSWWERVRDQGVFANRSASGDGAWSARLTALGPAVGGTKARPNTAPNTAAGMMIRESLSHSCGRFVLVQVESSGELVCRWRDKTGDQDDNQRKVLGTVTLPVHVKLVKTAAQIQIFTSADGKEWGQPRFTRDSAFGADGRVGLFICSGNPGVSATATFDALVVSDQGATK